MTEGTDTEPNYFEEIKRIINEKYSDRIVLKVEGKGDNTLNLFEKARESASAPGTKVYELIEILKPYL